MYHGSQDVCIHARSRGCVWGGGRGVTATWEERGLMQAAVHACSYYYKGKRELQASPAAALLLLLAPPPFCNPAPFSGLRPPHQ
jgi:hypothetical protein